MLKLSPWTLARHHADQNDFAAAATLAEKVLTSDGNENQGYPLSIAAAYLMAADWARMANCDEVAKRLGLRALQAMEDKAMLRKMSPAGDLDKVVLMLGWLIDGAEGVKIVEQYPSLFYAVYRMMAQKLFNLFFCAGCLAMSATFFLALEVDV